MAWGRRRGKGSHGEPGEQWLFPPLIGRRICLSDHLAQQLQRATPPAPSVRSDYRTRFRPGGAGVRRASLAAGHIYMYLVHAAQLARARVQGSSARDAAASRPSLGGIDGRTSEPPEAGRFHF